MIKRNWLIVWCIFLFYIIMFFKKYVYIYEYLNFMIYYFDKFSVSFFYKIL